MRTGNAGIRLSLGSVYPTDLAARIFYISLAYVTLKKFKLKLPEYISLLAICVYIFCNRYKSRYFIDITTNSNFGLL